jgi:hypothetical protein
MILVINCQRQKQYPIIDNLNFYNTSLASDYQNKLYFPIKSFQDTSLFNKLDTFQNKWYSEQLGALKEPIIFSDTSKFEIYRFTWLRTFHNPIAIRIEHRDKNYFMVWKVCDGKGGYAPGKLKVSKIMQINRQEWKKFIKLIRVLDFWSLPTSDYRLTGVDGAQWILEGKSENRYHVVDRWGAFVNTEYYECCNFLLNQTDIKIENQEKY